MFFKIAPKVTKYLGNFCNNISHENFQKLPNLVSLGSSVTRVQDHFSMFGHLLNRFNNVNLSNSTKNSKFCQILNIAFENCPKTLKFCQSGKNSPILVTRMRPVAFSPFTRRRRRRRRYERAYHSNAEM